jgi:hypothetical protein
VQVEGEVLVGCDVLQGVCDESVLKAGDQVLVALTGDEPAKACVVGIVTPYAAVPAGDAVGGRRRISGSEVVIEAGTRLELRVGDSCIRIGADGTIVVYGKNVLTRARSANRIRGATVHIN